MPASKNGKKPNDYLAEPNVYHDHHHHLFLSHDFHSKDMSGIHVQPGLSSSPLRPIRSSMHNLVVSYERYIRSSRISLHMGGIHP